MVNNFHICKPKLNQLIYWIGPTNRNILGWYRGGLQFEECEKKYPGYVPKWWYPAEPEIENQIAEVHNVDDWDGNLF
jgi:hypothetical protein